MSHELCSTRYFVPGVTHQILSELTRDEIGIAVASGKILRVSLKEGPANFLEMIAHQLSNEGTASLEITGPVPHHEDREFVACINTEEGTGWVMVRMIDHP